MPSSKIIGKISSDPNIHGKVGEINGVKDHNRLANRNLPDQHPIEAITGLREELDKRDPAANQKIKVLVDEEEITFGANDEVELVAGENIILEVEKELEDSPKVIISSNAVSANQKVKSGNTEFADNAIVDIIADTAENNPIEVTGNSTDNNISIKHSKKYNAAQVPIARKVGYDKYGHVELGNEQLKISDLFNDSSFVTQEALDAGLDDKVDKVNGKGLSTNDFTDNYLNIIEDLATVATSGDYNDLDNKPTIPTKTSDLTNDSDFITSNALDGYATEQYVDEALNNKQDTIDDLDAIRSGAAAGATAVQPAVLNDYVTELELATELEDYVEDADLAIVATTGDYDDLINKPDLTGFATKQEVSTGLNAKQNTISDLDTIRSGAALGATALQEVPSDYITESELTNILADYVESNDLANVATSGDYDDLLNKPTIPTKTSDLNNDSNFVTSSDLANYATKQELSSLGDSLDAIEGLIPEQASSSNQLADKDFVNSSIATATANFKGTFNVVTDLGLTIDATEAQIATALAIAVSNPTLNDYAYVSFPDPVVATETTKFDRYKYSNNSWAYEYTLNNSSFTADQWAAINSGINTNLVIDINNNTTARHTHENKTLLDSLTENTLAGWNNKYNKPAEGIPKTDLADSVQDSLELADSAVQSVIEGNTDGTIRVDGTEVSVHGLGDNAFNSTPIPESDSDLTNDRYIRYDTNAQNLNDTQKANARTNIGAGTSSFSGDYNDLNNKPELNTEQESVVQAVSPETHYLTTTTVKGVGDSTETASHVSNSVNKSCGNADVDIPVTVMTGFSNNDAAYKASYNANKCSLRLTPIANATTTVIPAKQTENTITQYTFEDVDVPIANAQATTVATGQVGSTQDGAAVITSVDSTPVSVISDVTFENQDNNNN